MRFLRHNVLDLEISLAQCRRFRGLASNLGGAGRHLDRNSCCLWRSRERYFLTTSTYHFGARLGCHDSPPRARNHGIGLCGERVLHVLIIVRERRGLRINYLTRCHVHHFPRRVIERELDRRRPGDIAPANIHGTGRIGVGGRDPVPHRPKSVDIGMMQPENRIQCGCVRISHPPKRQLAADVHVNSVMRQAFHRLRPEELPIVVGPRRRTAEPEIASRGVRVRRKEGRAKTCRKINVFSRDRRGIPQVDRWCAQDVHPLDFKKRVRRTVGQIRLQERWWQGSGLRARSIAVIPIRQSPVGGTAELHHRCPYDLFEEPEVHPMPRQKEPRAVLALVPELVLHGLCWQGAGLH